MGYNDRITGILIDDYLYAGDLYVGENRQPMKVIYDTGSDWLIIEGVDCETCNGNKFDPAQSPYFEKVRERIEDKQYGSFIHIRG